MSWNYRIIAHEGYYAVHEVYYNSDKKPNGYTKNPVSLWDEDIDGINIIIENILSDISKYPVLYLDKDGMFKEG